MTTEVAPPEFACTIRTPPGSSEASGRLVLAKAEYWGPETREIPVSFLDISDRATIDMILSHANAWDCGVRFVWSPSGGWVRITTGPGGYWAGLGKGILRWPAGQPNMNLQ